MLLNTLYRIIDTSTETKVLIITQIQEKENEAKAERRSK